MLKLEYKERVIDQFNTGEIDIKTLIHRLYQKNNHVGIYLDYLEKQKKANKYSETRIIYGHLVVFLNSDVEKFFYSTLTNYLEDEQTYSNKEVKYEINKLKYEEVEILLVLVIFIAKYDFFEILNKHYD
jgi:hypothetical protein